MCGVEIFQDLFLYTAYTDDLFFFLKVHHTTWWHVLFVSNFLSSWTKFNPLSANPQNGQTHTNNSYLNVLDILWGWCLKG